MDFLFLLNLIGTFSFAISGALAGEKKDFDKFGVSVLAMVTAIGGGTLRDILMGSTPVAWLQDYTVLIVVLAAIPVSYFFNKTILKLHKAFFMFDTIGIGLFTVLGVQKALEFGIAPIYAILMGVISAVFGGVLRDTLSNEIPLIFRKEIYATACLTGASVYILLSMVSDYDILNTAVSMGIIILVRILSVKLGWSIRFKRNPMMGER